MGDDWHPVTHPKEVDHLVGYDTLRWQFGGWNIEIAADQSGEQQEHGGTGADT